MHKKVQMDSLALQDGQLDKCQFAAQRDGPKSLILVVVTDYVNVVIIILFVLTTTAG